MGWLCPLDAAGKVFVIGDNEICSVGPCLESDDGELPQCSPDPNGTIEDIDGYVECRDAFGEVLVCEPPSPCGCNPTPSSCTET